MDEAPEDHRRHRRRPVHIPDRMPLMIDGSITLYDLRGAAMRIDADSGRDSPFMTAAELVEMLSYYIHPSGYGGRGASKTLGLQSE